MPKSVILFISNPIFFIFVSRLIQLFNFESLLDFYVSLERINSHTDFFVGKCKLFFTFLFLEIPLSILIINLNDNLIFLK